MSKGYYNDSKLGREYSLALPGNNQYPVYFQLNEVQTSSIEYYNLPMHWKDIKAQRGNTTSADIVALKKDGTLWKWGTSSTYPTQIGTQKDWDELSSASATTFIKKTDGTWWVMGSNYAGIFGNNTTTNSTTPISIGNQWKSISCGYYHVIAIHNDGTLWAWGLNDNGQLGNGTTTNSSVPVQISTDTNWYKTSAGLDHSVAIKRDGSLYAWGLNDKGQLGDLTTISKLTPTLISCPSILLAVENFGFKNNEVEIYPNPTTDFINISSKEKINTAEIYDINGRILLKTNKVEDKIFLENLNAGIYLLKLQFENGSIETQKIIKR